jgi:hypothetical protein
MAVRATDLATCVYFIYCWLSVFSNNSVSCIISIIIIIIMGYVWFAQRPFAVLLRVGKKEAFRIRCFMLPNYVWGFHSWDTRVLNLMESKFDRCSCWVSVTQLQKPQTKRGGVILCRGRASWFRPRNTLLFEPFNIVITQVSNCYCNAINIYSEQKYSFLPGMQFLSCKN